MNILNGDFRHFGAAIGAAITLGIGCSNAQSVFSDSFASTTGASFTTTAGAIGTSATWSLASSGADWGAKIDGGQLTLTNDAGAAPNVNGWAFGYTATASISAPYAATLNTNTSTVNWSFNMQQVRLDPAGFGIGVYGAAFVLGATSTTPSNSGDGYAIVLGQSGVTDPIRLVSFSGGLQNSSNLTNIISASPTLSDVGADFLSIGVSYNPTTNGWSLLGRNDGSSAFADPTSGVLSALGSATNSTYTGTSLGFLGGYWQGSTLASQTAQFDNVSVTLTPVPEPAALLTSVVLASTALFRRRRAKSCLECPRW